MVEAPPGSKKTAGVSIRAGENPALFFSMKYIAIIFSIFIITIVVLADLDKLGPLHRIYDFPYGDKAGHVILFGLLNYFITRACLSSPRVQNRKSLPLRLGLSWPSSSPPRNGHSNISLCECSNCLTSWRVILIWWLEDGWQQIRISKGFGKPAGISCYSYGFNTKCSSASLICVCIILDVSSYRGIPKKPVYQYHSTFAAGLPWMDVDLSCSRAGG